MGSDSAVDYFKINVKLKDLGFTPRSVQYLKKYRHNYNNNTGE
jgi:hypothetical protein